MKKTRFQPLRLWASTLAMMAGSPLVYAQESASAPVAEEVMVTGFRAAVAQSQEIKRENTSIVEAISAEDIGKLPDTSIAESLGRLPGLAGQRKNGRTSGLTVRGFSENWVGTSMNGRELLGMGDNRGVEYDLYPAEIISAVEVYKTPDASLITQGVGGTVDLQTIRPLDASPVTAINVSLEQNGLESANPDFDDNGHRLSFIYSDKFLDDTLGFSVAVATMESPSQEQQFRGWGYPDAVNGDAADGVDLNGAKVLGGHDSFVRSAMMERDSVTAVFQYKVNEKLTLTADALYIDFKEDKVFRGLEEAGAEWGAANYTATSVEDGLVTSGYWDGFHSVIRNDAERKTAELTTFGLNAEFYLNDDWTLEADLSSGKVDKHITNVESYSGVGRAGSASQGDPAARSWRMTDKGVMFSAHPSISMPDYTDKSLIKLAGPQAWGGALAPVPGFDNTAQDGFVNNPDWDESLDSFRLSARGQTNWSIVSGLEFGLNYSDRSKTKDNRGAFLTAPTYPGDAAIPEQYVVGTADLSFLGVGDIIAYDSIKLFEDNYYIRTAAEDLETSRKGDSYTVDETVLTLYAMADLSAQLGPVPVTGNVGVQVVDTEQSSSGWDSVTGSDGYVDASPVDGSDSYTKVLPSLNLTFEVHDDHLIRTGLSKAMSRARMDDMRPNNQVSFAFNDSKVLEPSDPRNSAWSGSSGNPTLRPYEVAQFDLAYEWYFAEDGLLGATYFYKDLKNWHKKGDSIEDFSQYYIPGYHVAEDGVTPPVLFEGVVNTREDGLTGSTSGFEFQASLPFHIFSDSLDGFGVLATATFTDGSLDVDEGEEDRIPGLSEEIYQLTAYFERAGFQFRISGTDRSEFLTEDRGLSLSLVDATDDGATLWDAQVGYDFGGSGVPYLEGLTVTLQAQNLTDEATAISDELLDERHITRYQSFGTNYLLGLNYKF